MAFVAASGGNGRLGAREELAAAVVVDVLRAVYERLGRCAEGVARALRAAASTRSHQN